MIWLRAELPGVILSVTLLTAGCWMLFHAWLRLKRTADHDDDLGLRTTTQAALIWSAPQLLAIPIFSRDLFAYLNQGRLVLAGEDPYQTGVSSLDNWFQLGTDDVWAEDATPYGPLFLWAAAGIMRLTGDNADLAIILFRLLCVAGVVLIILYVPKLAAALGKSPSRAQWVASANPLLIISFISSAHNDALMIGLALMSIYAAMHERALLAIVLMTLSIGVKLITLVLLPFIGLVLAGAGASWARRFSYWFITAGLSGGLLVVIGLIDGFGLGWISVMISAGSGATFWAPLAMLAGPIAGVLLLLGQSPDPAFDIIGTVGRAASVLIVLWLMFTNGDIYRRMMWAFAAIVLLSPLIQPWYLLWILPLFAAAGYLTDPGCRWPLQLTVIVTGFFLGYGAFDQLFIQQFLDERYMQLASAGVSLAAITVILIADRWARSVVLRGAPGDRL